MHFLSTNSEHITLDSLNEYCLLQIFSLLDIKDQCALYGLNSHLRHVVRRIWQQKYALKLDFNIENQLKFLLASEIFALLKCVAPQTEALLNINDIAFNMLKLLHKMNLRCAVIRELSFKGCNFTMLPEMWPNLKILKLLPSSENCNCQLKKMYDIKYLGTLQDIRLPVQVLADMEEEDTIAIIEQLPKLHVLTIYIRPTITTTSQTMTDDQNEIRRPRVTTDVERAIFKLFSALRNRACHRQIVGLQLKCQLDKRFMQQLLEAQTKQDAHQQHNLFALRKFGWQTHLNVHYDINTGSIKWLTHDTQVKPLMLKFLQNCQNHLHEVDFTHNTQITSSFLKAVQKILNKRTHFAIENAAEMPEPHTELPFITFEFD